MDIYKNISRESGVVAYEVREDSITVKFNNGISYLYNYQSTGRDHVEEMKRLAMSGKGLSTYISKFIKNNYVQKLL